MRRIVAALVLSVALVGAAGCSQSGTSSGSGSTSSPSATGSPTPTVDASANTQQVCADAKKMTEEITAKLISDLPKTIQSGGDAVATVKGWFTSWTSGLRAQAARAADPELKTALTDLADGLDEVTANIKTIDDLKKLNQLNSPKFDAAAQKLEKLCP
jgi:hypothetical protein